MSKTICIGVGHGGSDPGAFNGNRREADDNLKLSLAVAKLIESQGHNAVLTRTTDIAMTIAQRRQKAIDVKADLFIDIHRNSFTNNTAKGIEIWIRDNRYRQAASEVLERLGAIENQGNRGIKVGAYQVLYNMPMPAMLLELGFISNTRDNELYDKHFDANATAISRGILAALGEDWKEPGTSTAKPTAPLYRVQVGAFTDRKNAAGLVDEIRAKGYPCFIVEPAAVKEDE
jgi:N-acetylmuramoyl-L-alanine amidase